MNLNEDAAYSNREVLKLIALTNLLTIKIIKPLREEMIGICGDGMNGTLLNRPYNHYAVTLSSPCGPENVDKLAKADFGIVRNVQENGPDQEDLDKVKETLKKQNEDTMKDNDHWLDGLTIAWIERTDPQWILNCATSVDALTLQNIKDAANKYLAVQIYIKAVLYP